MAQGYFYPFWVVELHILPFDDKDPRTAEFLKVLDFTNSSPLLFNLVLTEIFFKSSLFLIIVLKMKIFHCQTQILLVDEDISFDGFNFPNILI